MLFGFRLSQEQEKEHKHSWCYKERMVIAREGAKEASDIIGGYIIRYECKCGVMRYDRIDSTGLVSIKIVDNNGKIIP